MCNIIKTMAILNAGGQDGKIINMLKYETSNTL